MGEDARAAGHGISPSTINVISNCYSETNVFVHVEGTVHGTGLNSGLGVGGFAGKLNGDISHCYAKGNVSASSSHRVFAGGFVGHAMDGTTIQYCFATGNVSVPTEGRDLSRAGGFAGYAQGNIHHSYALGDVFFHSTGTSNYYAGGFAGQNDRELINCFAGGSVILHRGASSGTSFAGGLVGIAYTTNASIQNCVVVPRNIHNGLSITVTSPPNEPPNNHIRHSGRVYGQRDNPPLTNFSNNHAWSEIRVFNNAAYSVPGAGTTPSSIDTTSGDGANATSGTLRTPTFWTLLGFTAINGWDLSTVGSRGHPVLAGLGGQ